MPLATTRRGSGGRTGDLYGFPHVWVPHVWRSDRLHASQLRPVALAVPIIAAGGNHGLGRGIADIGSLSHLVREPVRGHLEEERRGVKRAKKTNKITYYINYNT